MLGFKRLCLWFADLYFPLEYFMSIADASTVFWLAVLRVVAHVVKLTMGIVLMIGFNRVRNNKCVIYKPDLE